MSTNEVALLAKRVCEGNRRALAKAITLFEDSRPDERHKAAALLSELLPHAGKSVRIGVSGSPGVGKSTFIEAFGGYLIAQGKSLAVLAIDPTSPVSGGSILGDRVRMESLSAHAKAFIRPSPSGLTLGGVARHTREAIIACEAGGYDYILVETVGVGQSETLVASMVDLFLMLAMPNAGDEIQGIKRGILEMADIVAVTKADGPLARDAERTKLELKQALGLARAHTESNRVPPVFLISSTENTGLKELDESLVGLLESRKKSGEFAERRQSQLGLWFEQELQDELAARLMRNAAATTLRKKLAEDVKVGKVSATQAAAAVIVKFLETTTPAM